MSAILRICSRRKIKTKSRDKTVVPVYWDKDFSYKQEKNYPGKPRPRFTGIADLIQKESRVMLRKGQWSTFICVLALASVIGKIIFCHYHDFGEAKVKLLFNQRIIPRSYYEVSSSSFEIFNVLYCQLAKGTQSFKANHFVPLILHTKK